MADNSDVQYLRLLLAEPNAPSGNVPAPGEGIVGSLFSTDALEMLIDRTAMITRAAELGWKAKAAYLQTLIDVDESGVSRKLSQMFKQAMQMAEQYKVSADEEWMSIQGSMRTVGVGASPWGPQFGWSGAVPVGTMIIGDVSRAGAGGSIFFIEVPVDPNLLTEKFGPDTAPAIEAASVQIAEIEVPTDRRHALYVEVGRTFDYRLDYLDPATGAVVDLTGWTATITVRTAPGGPQLYEAALSTDPSGNRFVISIAATATAEFAFVQGDYEVVATDTDSNSISLVSGTMYVNLGD